MVFNNSKIIYRFNSISHRRVVEGALIRGIKVIGGNKAFTTEDPFSRRLILKEDKVKTDELRVSTPAQQIEINANNPNHGINIPSQQNVA